MKPRQTRSVPHQEKVGLNQNKAESQSIQQKCSHKTDPHNNLHLYRLESKAEEHGRSHVKERRAEGGFMTDSRTAYTRRDGYSDRYAWKEGGKDRKLTSAYTRQNSQPHDAYNVERIESFAHRTQLRNIGESFVHQPADETFYDSHKSSGKRIASQIVTPARHDNDDNVTKHPRVSPCLLTFSPTEKVLPADAQIIGALNDMEIIDTTNTDVELHDTMMVAETQDDDLLGEDLMDMEDGTNTETEGNGRKVVWKGDTTALV
ncbi:hypothetical protein YC2023_061689 [Brassica napus]